MGFSDWAKEQLSGTLPKCYLVENQELSSSSSGLRYRRSPSHNDGVKVTKLKPIPWGSIVCGTLEENGAFLKLEDGYFLPVFTQSGARVLHEIQTEEKPTERPRPKASQDDATFVPDGPGAWYEVVVDRVALRVGPSLAARATGQLRRGEQVELFGWDDSGLWRQVVDHRLSRSGFVLLDHADLGPLLRPRGEPLCIRPLNILAVAAAEGRFEDLERFLKQKEEAGEVDFQDPRGPAVVLAVRSGKLRCCVRLLRAGATEGTSPELRALRECSKEELEELQDKSDEELELWMRRALQAQNPPAEDDRAREEAVPEVAKEVQEVQQVNEVKQAQEMKKESAPQEGVLYEVAFDAVWIRREPDSNASRVSKRIKGQRVRIIDFDESGLWGRTVFKTSEGMDEGWMLLAHGEFGDLLRPVDDDGQGYVVRPQ